VPALGALAAEPLYVLVDTAVVGHLGTSQLGGLAVAGTLLTTAFWLCNFLAYGTTSVVARLVGAGDRRSATEAAVHGLAFALVLGVALGALGLVGGPAALSLMGARRAVRTNALVYLRISLFGAPAVLAALAGTGYLRGVQDTRTPLVVQLVANAANLVLELVLILGLGFGIAASAAATVVAQYGAAIVYIVIARRDAALVGDIAWRPTRAGVRAVATVARDLVIRTGALLGALALATAVASRLGSVVLGAHQIAYQLWTFLALTLDAIAIAGQALVGTLLGAGDPTEARRAAMRMVEWSVVFGLVAGLFVAALRVPLAALFTTDHAVRATAARALWLVAVLQPLNAVVFVLDGVLIGAGEFRYLAWGMAASAAVFVPVALLVLAHRGGIVALWGALATLMVARAVANISRFAGTRWMVTGARR